MTVQYRYTDALAGDLRLGRRNDHAILDLTPDTKRLLLALFFLAADVRDDISLHLRPFLEGLACSGDRLISRSDYLVRLEFLPCGQHRRVALDRAVRLYCDKASGRAKTLFLILDDIKVLRIDLRNDHRDVRGPAMCAVIGYDRCLGLCIFFFDRADLVFCHINCRKYKIDRCRYLLDLI